MAMLDLLADAPMPRDDRENVQTIRASVDMMRAIVNDALDLSKVSFSLRCSASFS